MSITRKLGMAVVLAVSSLAATPAETVTTGEAAAAPANAAVASASIDGERWVIGAGPIDACLPFPCWRKRCCLIVEH